MEIVRLHELLRTVEPGIRKCECRITCVVNSSDNATKENQKPLKLKKRTLCHSVKYTVFMSVFLEMKRSISNQDEQGSSETS